MIFLEDTFNGKRLPALHIGFDKDSIDANRSFGSLRWTRGFLSCKEPGKKVLTKANDAVCSACHADVCDIGSSTREHAPVSGRYICMRAEQCSDYPCHTQPPLLFLTRRV